MTQVAITARCANEDLTSPGLLPVAHLLVEKLHELRGQAPDEGEPISSLRERDCRSLHSGRYRGVTWYDRNREAVWLLAAHIHREDSREDSYAVAAHLEEAGRLYPTDADYTTITQQIAESERESRIEVEARALRDLRDQVLRTPGGGVQQFTSPDRLYAEMWAEVVPDLALLTLRMRIFRRAAHGIPADELTALVRAVFEDAPHQEVREDDVRFRRYEGYLSDWSLPAQSQQA